MKQIFSIMKKELKRFFTDRRMLLSLFLPGILLYVMYSLMGNFFSNSLFTKVDKTHQFDIVLTDNFNLESEDKDSLLGLVLDKTILGMDYVKPGIKYVDKKEVDTYTVSLQNKEIDLLVIFDDNFEYNIFNTGHIETKPNLKVMYNSELSTSETLYSIAVSAVDALYQNYSLNSGIDNPNVGKSSSMVGQVLSFIFPMITVALLYSVTLSICPESIAGEKERGTLASILITPVKRSELAIGKISALSIVSIASGIVSALSIVLSLPKLMGGMSISISPIGYALLFVLVISVVVLFVTITSSVSTFAKTIKEATSYCGPLSGLLILLAIVPGVLDVSSVYTAFIPLLNVFQCMSSLLSGTLNIAYFLVTIAMNVVFTGALIFLIVKLFNNESIMFNK